MKDTTSDLKEEEEVSEEETTESDDTDPSSKEDAYDTTSESEPTTEELKAENERLKQDNLNYKLERRKHKLSEEKRTSIFEEKKEEKKENISEEQVLSVLYKQNEKRVLKDAMNPDSSLYLPELVDDTQFNEIVGYLPRNVDRSSPEGIHKALKLAIHSWKTDTGKEEKDDKEKKTRSVLGTSSKETVSGSETKKPERKKGGILKTSRSSMEEWYS